MNGDGNGLHALQRAAIDVQQRVRFVLNAKKLLSMK